MSASPNYIMPSAWLPYVRGSGNRGDEFIINGLYIMASSNLDTARINISNRMSGSIHNFFIVSGFPDLGYSLSSGFYPSGSSPTDPSGMTYYTIVKI